MKVRTLILLLTLVAIAAFTALNWSAFMTPTPLFLGVANVQAPLGLIMLGLLAFLSVLFLVFVVYLQMSVLLESRRHARELQANRELAGQAEASCFAELRGFLEVELKRQAGLDAESRTVVLARLDQLDRDFRVAVGQTGNTLAAYIGELEDLVERGQAVQRLMPKPPA